MKFSARLSIFYKDFILDPEGRSVLQKLKNLGFEEVQKVLVGKEIKVELECPSLEVAHHKISQMCDALLVNPIMESVQVEVD